MASLVKSQTPPAQAQFDNLLVWTLICMLALGLVMVYSASIATAEANKFTAYQPTYYLLRHAVYIVVGLIAGMVIFQVPAQTWQTYAPYLFLIGAALLMLVLIPGIGREVNGSRRWISLLIVNFQPSELMKLFAVLYAADQLAKISAAGRLESR